MADSEPIDVVYTWVDDSFPGYLDQLNRYAETPRDTDPKRTRDNLDILRYAMRSLEKNLPWVRNVYLFTCRPQVPAWLNLDHPKLKVVHHDQVMAAEHLPTFNSFGIVSHLHLLPGLSQRFLYIVDDMLVMSPDARHMLFAEDERPWVYLDRRKTVQLDALDLKTESNWNLALGLADRALQARFGGGARRHIAHAPQLIDRDAMAAMCDAFAEEIAATRASRFRAPGNVPPEYLISHWMLETGAGVLAPRALERRFQGYASLENWRAWTWNELRRLRWQKPLTVTLNDGFDDEPDPQVEAMVRRQLDAWFPDPCDFETPAA